MLFAVIGGLLVFWWTRRPTTPGEPWVALVRKPTAAAAAVASPEALSGEGSARAGGAADLVGEGGGTDADVEAGPQATPDISPTPTLTPTPLATATPGPIRHTVKQGDTVVSIAGQYGSTVKDIIEANGLNANGFLRVGQELIVPVAGPSGGPGPTATPTGGTLIYTVQAGDTVSLIADRFGSTINWILKANNLKPTDFIHVGQSLLVPLSDVTPTPTPTVLVSPSPTPTRGLPFGAPALLLPADASSVSREDEVLLSWASVGTLAKDQWYVVTLEIPGRQGAPAPYWTKSTTWRLPREYRGEGPDPVEFLWSVQVLTGTPGNPGNPASPPAVPRRFTWQ